MIRHLKYCKKISLWSVHVLLSLHFRLSHMWKECMSYKTTSWGWLSYQLRGQCIWGPKSQHGGKVPTFEPHEPLKIWLLSIKVSFGLFYARNFLELCWKLDLLVSSPKPHLQKVFPCKHSCHTWHLGLGTNVHGVFLGTIGQNPSISKSNQLHVIFQPVFDDLRYIPQIPLKWFVIFLGVLHFNLVIFLESYISTWLFLKLKRFICNQQPVLHIHCWGHRVKW